MGASHFDLVSHNCWQHSDMVFRAPDQWQALLSIFNHCCHTHSLAVPSAAFPLWLRPSLQLAVLSGVRFNVGSAGLQGWCQQASLLIQAKVSHVW